MLSNVMLNELDRELERRGLRFVRFADDCMIFSRSRKSAERAMNNAIAFVEKKLFLKVNRTKTTVAHVRDVKYLGYGFYIYKDECHFRVHPKSVAKMRKRVKELTDRNAGIGNTVREQKYRDFIEGWIDYFKLADMKGLMAKTDSWARHRIRAVYWKQWKKVKTRYKMLRALKLEEWQVHMLANTRKGTWRASQMLSIALTNRIIAKLGYTSMLDYYLKVC